MAEARAPIPIFKKLVLVLPAPWAREKDGASKSAERKIPIGTQSRHGNARDKFKKRNDFKWIQTPKLFNRPASRGPAQND